MGGFKIMKRIFSFLLLFGLLLALAGCGKKEDNKVKSSEEEKTKKVTFLLPLGMHFITSMVIPALYSICLYLRIWKAPCTKFNPFIKP